MLKKLLAFSLISIALVGCSKSKEAVYDKCLTQANETFDRNINANAKFLYSCMNEYGYRLNNGCDNSDAAELMSIICYVKK